MRNLALLASAVCILLTGCAQTETYVSPSVTKMPPGYGVMLASFRYVPGVSQFPQAQVLYDVRYAAERLKFIGYEPFIVYRGGNYAQVGIRASSHGIAESMKKEIDRSGKIDLKDGNTLNVPETEIVNLAELQVGALAEIK